MPAEKRERRADLNNYTITYIPYISCMVDGVLKTNVFPSLPGRRLENNNNNVKSPVETVITSQ